MIGPGYFYVHRGPAAIRVHGGWIGYASGNRQCEKVRKDPRQALRYARHKEQT